MQKNQPQKQPEQKQPEKNPEPQKPKEIELDELFKIFEKHDGKPDQFTKDSPEEDDLEKDDDFVSFGVSKSYIAGNKKRIDFDVRSFYINPETSELISWGYCGGMEFRIGGSVYGTGEFDLEFESQQENVLMRIVSEVEVKKTNSDFVFTYRDEGFKFKIKLDLEPFKGTYQQDGRDHDLVCSFNIEDNQIVGLSRDPAGLSVWEGAIKPKNGQVELYKQYILSHGLDYDGAITKDALPTIKGEWNLKKISGAYTMTQQERKPSQPKPVEQKKPKPSNRHKKEQKKQGGRINIGIRLDLNINLGFHKREKPQKKPGEGRRKPPRPQNRKKKAPKPRPKPKPQQNQKSQQQIKQQPIQQQPVQQQQQQQPQVIINLNQPSTQPQQQFPQQQQQFQQQPYQQPYQQQQQFPQQQEQFPQSQPVQQRPQTVQQTGCCSIF